MQKFSNLQITFHWLTAILVLALVGSGLAFTYEIAGAGRETIIAHQIVGQMLIALLVFRIAARLARKTPEIKTAHAAWERALAGSVHLALYGALIGFVVTGYVSASAMRTNALVAPVDIGFARSDLGEAFLELHFALKWALLGLLGLHIAGALKHQIIDRDSTLSNMLFKSSR